MRKSQKTRTVKPRKRRRKSNDVGFEATGPLFQALGVDLTLIEGIDVGTALVILGEIGVDVSRFPDRHGFWGRFVKSLQNTAFRQFSVAFHGLGNGRRLC